MCVCIGYQACDDISNSIVKYKHSILQDDIEHFGDVGDVDSFLSNDGEDGRSLYGTAKQNPTEHKTEPSKGNELPCWMCFRT